MRKRDLKFIADAVGGTLVKGVPTGFVRRVCTDSRAVRPGDLFVALKGDRFDAHDYLVDVCQSGAAAVIVEADRGPKVAGEFGVIEVDDTRAALGRLAAAHRGDFDIATIAVGGSNGKTSTKELIAGLLRELGATVWSEASFNNDIGVPLTLLKLDDEHRSLIQEVGTNHPGELLPLVQMVRPQIGVITSIGREHLEHFGDVAGVIREEGVLAEQLPADGILILNGDDPHADELIGKTNARVVRVGFGEANEWQISDVVMTFSGMKFSLRGPKISFEELQIPLLGRHQVCNAGLAMAVGTELGLSSEQSRRALAKCTPPRGRLQLWEEGGIRVIDDAYNANADSMTAAIETLAELPVPGRRVAVLGDMAELGEHGESAHREIGALVAKCGIDMLFTVGSMGYCYAGAAKDAGVKVVSQFDEIAEAAISLQRVLRPGDAVLTKASRSAGLDRLVDLLRGQFGTETTDGLSHEQGEKDKAAIAA